MAGGHNIVIIPADRTGLFLFKNSSSLQLEVQSAGLGTSQYLSQGETWQLLHDGINVFQVGKVPMVAPEMQVNGSDIINQGYFDLISQDGSVRISNITQGDIDFGVAPPRQNSGEPDFEAPFGTFYYQTDAATDPWWVMSPDGVTWYHITSGGGGGGETVANTFEYMEEFLAPAVTAWSNLGFSAVQAVFEAAAIGISRYVLNLPSAGASAALGPLGVGQSLIKLAEHTFDLSFRFKLENFAADTIYELGVSDQGGDFGRNSTIYFDASHNATNFVFRNLNPGVANTYIDTGVVADNAWHTFRLRSTTPGTFLFSLDGGAESAIAASNPDSGVSPYIQVNTSGSSVGEITQSILLDYFHMRVTGLSR